MLSCKMWCKLIVFSALFVTVFSYNNSLTSSIPSFAFPCSRNETRMFLGCESSCANLQEDCQLNLRCTCNNGFYRDVRTNLCVTKTECSNYANLFVIDEISTFLRRYILPFLPRQVSMGLETLRRLIRLWRILQSLTPRPEAVTNRPI